MGTEQKVAVITGASQGIGAALAKAYRDRNYRVVATACNQPLAGACPNAAITGADYVERTLSTLAHR